MHEAVPDGIDWSGLGVGYNGHQIDIKGVDDLKTDNLDRVTGYDPDEFMVMELVGYGEDPKDERTRRSHLGLLVTRRVNKIVLLPVLKDHGSAGVTGALKNMSHGLVNNVCRSHSTPDTNVCNQFIPQVVTHPIIRKKCVLQIMDGIKGVYQGGPAASRPEWTWENNALLFATDPVAMDHVLWRYIDAKRKEKGLPPGRRLGQAGPRPAGDRGLRHPPAAAHPAGREPRPGHLRVQLAPGPEVLDRPQENQPGVRSAEEGDTMENDDVIARRQVNDRQYLRASHAAVEQVRQAGELVSVRGPGSFSRDHGQRQEPSGHDEPGRGAWHDPGTRGSRS